MRSQAKWLSAVTFTSNLSAVGILPEFAMLGSPSDSGSSRLGRQFPFGRASDQRQGTRADCALAITCRKDPESIAVIADQKEAPATLTTPNQRSVAECPLADKNA